MKDCCEFRTDISKGQRRMLQIVLAINATMFVVELVAGFLAHSTALLADSVDMLGDAIVYGFSLYAISRGPRWQARAALLKGGVMAAFGLGVLGEVATKLARGLVPAVEVMTGIGLLALVANASVLVFLWRHRADDLNMRSAWLCSRNDVVANAGVLLAAGGVAVTGSAWPDIVVGLAIAGLFAASAREVIVAARRDLRALSAR
jgi:Co/Zn/Cd efflux system component